MGLAAKRAVERIAEEVVPGYEQELLACVGSPVGIMIDWTYLLEHAAAVEGLEQWGLPAVVQALKHICADEVGRAALAGSVQTIRLSQWPAGWPAGTIADGNLDLAWDWASAERFTAEELEEHLSTQL